MRVLVLGAGGKTGGAVVQEAQAAGHQVTAFVHHAGGYDGPAGVAVAEGDATDAEAVAAAVAGQDAVIDTIGGKTPYKSNVTLEADVARAVIAAMTRSGVRHRPDLRPRNRAEGSQDLSRRTGRVAGRPTGRQRQRAPSSHRGDQLSSADPAL